MMKKGMQKTIEMSVYVDQSDSSSPSAEAVTTKIVIAVR